MSEELGGGIEGEASISYLIAYRDDKVASFVGLVRVVGRIGERSGSFVMQDIGTFECGVAKGYWTILPASSTSASWWVFAATDISPRGRRWCCRRSDVSF